MDVYEDVLSQFRYYDSILNIRDKYLWWNGKTKDDNNMNVEYQCFWRFDQGRYESIGNANLSRFKWNLRLDV